MKAQLKDEIDALAKAAPGGLLKPERVVEYAAKRRDSALHAEFVWDDTEAGRLYRVEQAKRLIRVYVVAVPPSDVKVRALVSVPTDRAQGGGYRTTAAVLRSSVRRQQMVEDAFKELLKFPQRYGYLPELGPFFAELERLVERHRGELLGDEAA
jgi:hypothetical protein